MYGYKLFVLRLTPPNKPMNFIEFDDPGLGKGGARELLRSTAAAATEGESDEKKGVYSRFDSVDADGWGFLLTAAGGPFGEEAEVVDRLTGGARPKIAKDDAVLRDARLLFIVPSDGHQGVLVSEARGNSHLTSAVVRRMNTTLRGVGAVIRLDREVADDVAWTSFLDNPDVAVTGVELIQHQRSAQEGRLTDQDNVRRAKLTLDLEPGGTETQSRIRQAISVVSIRAGGSKIKLAGLVGLREYGDDAFDEERLVVVQDGKQRKLNVTRGWPGFTYQIGEERPDVGEFLKAVRGATTHTLDALNIDRPGDWWPRPPVTS